MCHKTSPLGIHPDTEYVFDDHGNLIANTSNPGAIPKKLNSLIVGYGAPYFNDWADTTSYGPPLGEDRPRTDDFMNSCTSGLNLNQTSVNKVKGLMTCTDCHSARGAGEVGLLNFPETTRHLKTPGNQIYQYLSQGWMPPNMQLLPNDKQKLDELARNKRESFYKSVAPHEKAMLFQLLPNEREALYQCLMQEYFDFNTITGTFVDWLRTGPSSIAPNRLVFPKPAELHD